VTDNLLKEQIKRNPPQTQAEGCAIAARRSIAKFGPEPERRIRAVATGLASGLYGPAYKQADEKQKHIWINLCEREYRKALG